MTNYYEILGLQPSAGQPEIKAAFRRLAKIYHPDKNPEGKDYFENIFKAYETLSNPVLKSSYDYKLNYHQTHTERENLSVKKKDTKQWRFDEKELKRRQYYNEHFKKHAKETVSVEVEKKSNYNEFKYILFATPLAVILFLLIMKLAGDSLPASTEQQTTIKAKTNGSLPVAELRSGLPESPFGAYFGEPTFFRNGEKLNLKNNTGKDVIVCFFTNGRFVRDIFIPKDRVVVATELPQQLNVKYHSGLDFDPGKTWKSTLVSGGFKSRLEFYETKKTIECNSGDELVLVPGINSNFKRINEQEFFKRNDL